MNNDLTLFRDHYPILAGSLLITMVTFIVGIIYANQNNDVAEFYKRANLVSDFIRSQWRAEASESYDVAGMFRSPPELNIFVEDPLQHTGRIQGYERVKRIDDVSIYRSPRDRHLLVTHRLPNSTKWLSIVDNRSETTL